MPLTRRKLPEPPSASVEVLELREKLAEVADRLSDLARISHEQERVIDRLHLETQTLRAGELQRAMTPLLRGLMRIYDYLDNAAAATVPEDPPGPAMLAGFRDMVADLLYNQGVDLYAPAPGEAFDPKEHRGVAPVEVGDPALDRTIARCLRPGFRCEGRVLREADVEVYRLIKTATGEDSMKIRNGEENG